MKLHTHLVDAFDVKIVGPEPEVNRYRAHVARMRELLDSLEWSANLGQNSYGCGICRAESDDETGHDPDCALAAALGRSTTSAKDK